MPSTVRNYYGNNVTLRTAYLPTGAKKSWIDFETELPKGTLQRFSFFVHNISRISQGEVRLQIWRPVDIIDYEFKLVWEVKLTVQTGLVGNMYTVSGSNIF